MKKILCLLLSLCLLAGFSSTAYAADYTEEEYVEYLDDGSYYTTTIITYHNSETTLYANTISGTKTTTYKASDGRSLWSVSVTGTFTYTGSSARCIDASASSASYSSSWTVGYAASYLSGATAYGTATGTEYFAFSPVGSITETVALTCSNNGTLS